MSNDGTVSYEWSGEVYSLRFTYDAIDGIERKFGDDWMATLTDLFNGRSVEHLPFIASLATGQTQKAIKEASPAVVPFINALYRAWELAWHGQETKVEVQEDEKKSLISAMLSKARSKTG